MNPLQNILLLGRPASGKSEFIDFMKKQGATERLARYHLRQVAEMDDFPWIWEKFMEDHLWEEAGFPRRYSFGGSNPGMSKEGVALFDFCIQKFNHEFEKKYKDNAVFYKDHTLFIEFARGGKNAYATALQHLSDSILKNSSILFILVSFEESKRRNEARYQEKMKSSILAHKVPEETMNWFYQVHDWLEITGGKENGLLKVRNIEIPFVTMTNEPELTDSHLLDQRYRPALARLAELTNV